MTNNARPSRGTLRYGSLLAILVVLFMQLVFPDSVFAQVNEDNIVQDTLDVYEVRMQAITDAISGLLIRTFVLLALIEFTWGMVKNYIDNGGLQGFLSELVLRIMFIGFFLWLFQNGTQFPLDIVNSFRTLASNVPGSTPNLSPDNFIDIGKEFLAQSWDEILAGNIITGLGLMFASVIVFITMVILAAHLAVAILEFFVVGYGGFILLALGASRWTHGFAVGYLKYAMSVGMKLFVLFIIAAVVQTEMTAYFTNVAQADITNVWAVAAFALFSVILAIIAPQSVMGMMSGVSVASGAGAAAAASTLGGVATASAGAASTGMTAAAGAASASFAAGRLGTAAGHASGRGAVGSTATGVGAAAKGIGSSAIATTANKMSSIFPVQKSVGGQMAARMNRARAGIEKTGK